MVVINRSRHTATQELHDPPPSDEAAERRVLASLILAGSLPQEPESIAVTDAVLATLQPRDFSRQYYAQLYATIIQLRRAGQPWGLAAVSATGRTEQERLDIGLLVHEAVSFTSAPRDAVLVRDCSLRCQLLSVAQSLLTMADHEPLAATIQHALQRLRTLQSFLPDRAGGTTSPGQVGGVEILTIADSATILV